MTENNLTQDQVKQYYANLIEGQNSTSIQLSSGRWFDFKNPTPLSIDEITSPLSKLCRFTGQCDGFYSVGQHSIFVSYLVPKEYALWGLLHDAAESVLADINSPLKRLLPDYKAIEKTVEKVVLEGFGLYGDIPKDVHDADMQAFVWEQFWYMPQTKERVEWVNDNFPMMKKCPEHLYLMTQYDVRDTFKRRYQELTGV